MKRLISVGILACLLALTLVPVVTASSGNSISGVAAQPDGKIELVLEVNCTWTGPPRFVGAFNWANSETFPPLPGMQWAYQVISVTVPYDMKVDIYITDFALRGDNFELYEIDGMTPTTANLLGTTPWVPQGPDPDPLYTADPDVAWATPGFSHSMFTWYLTAGTHYFAIRAVASPWGSGSACIKFCPSNSPVGGTLLPRSSSVVSVIALVGAIGAAAIVVGSKKKIAS
jgi:hypothetical protein